MNIFVFADDSGNAMKVMSRAVRSGEMDEVPFATEGTMPYHSAITRRPVSIDNCLRRHPFGAPANLPCRAKYLMPLLKMHGDALPLYWGRVRGIAYALSIFQGRI